MTFRTCNLQVIGSFFRPVFETSNYIYQHQYPLLVNRGYAAEQKDLINEPLQSMKQRVKNLSEKPNEKRSLDEQLELRQISEIQSIRRSTTSALEKNLKIKQDIEFLRPKVDINSLSGAQFEEFNQEYHRFWRINNPYPFFSKFQTDEPKIEDIKDLLEKQSKGPRTSKFLEEPRLTFKLLSRIVNKRLENKTKVSEKDLVRMFELSRTEKQFLKSVSVLKYYQNYFQFNVKKKVSSEQSFFVIPFRLVQRAIIAACRIGIPDRFVSEFLEKSTIRIFFEDTTPHESILHTLFMTCFKDPRISDENRKNIVVSICKELSKRNSFMVGKKTYNQLISFYSEVYPEGITEISNYLQQHPLYKTSRPKPSEKVLVSQIPSQYVYHISLLETSFIAQIDYFWKTREYYSITPKYQQYLQKMKSFNQSLSCQTLTKFKVLLSMFNETQELPPSYYDIAQIIWREIQEDKEFKAESIIDEERNSEDPTIENEEAIDSMVRNFVVFASNDPSFQTPSLKNLEPEISPPNVLFQALSYHK